MEASCQCQELYALAKQEAEKHKQMLHNLYVSSAVYLREDEVVFL